MRTSVGGVYFRWERLEQLLTEATGSSDYDVTLAIDQLLDYILSDQGTHSLLSFAEDFQQPRLDFQQSALIARLGSSSLCPLTLPQTFSVQSVPVQARSSASSSRRSW